MISTIVILVCIAILLIHNQVVYKIRLRRIKEISKEANRRIHSGDHHSWSKLYTDLEADHQYLQVLQLWKWTYKQFYPKEVS